jgi:hypothetical protein
MIDRELPASETDKASQKEDGEKRKPQVVPEVPPCPICGRTWKDHNLMRVRECMPKLEEALRLAEGARIRASLS